MGMPSYIHSASLFVFARARLCQAKVLALLRAYTRKLARSHARRRSHAYKMRTRVRTLALSRAHVLSLVSTGVVDDRDAPQHARHRRRLPQRGAAHHAAHRAALPRAHTGPRARTTTHARTRSPPRLDRTRARARMHAPASCRGRVEWAASGLHEPF
eukprot:6185345-Pleurochrysis_carterae.AAC.2